ncbi:MAG: hypothetical protein ACRDZ7_01490 [Acidimicrobiia bacterium]
MPESEPPDDRVPTWNLAQQGTDTGVKWSVFVGDSSKQHRCISLDLDPTPFGPIADLVDPETGETIPPPPPLAAQLAGEGREHEGCAPAPSLIDLSSQPLYALTVHQPDSGKGTYSYAAGTAVPEIGQITAEFSDGTTAPAIVTQGTFIVIYPPTKKLAVLRPAVPKFPDLHCSIIEFVHPSIPSGPPSFTSYGDGGCTGYTVEFKRFG